MKVKVLLLSVLLTLVCFEMSGDDSQTERINLAHTHQPGNHNNLPVPADEPDVYYNSTTQQIIIDGTGFVSYYDVEICSVVTWDVVISTQVNGSYDTIDISSLATGEYCITIDSPAGNSYEGFFDTY